MPPDTLFEMTLGFTVIMGIILIYVLSLVIRIRKAKAKFKGRSKK